MKKVFHSLRELDQRARDEFFLPSTVLMENAGAGASEIIKRLFANNKESETSNEKSKNTNEKKLSVQIICGSGDNGGDGLVMARQLADYFAVKTVCLKEPKSEMCKKQKERLDAIGIKTTSEIATDCDILVDAFLGTGLKGDLRDEDIKRIEKINSIKAYKIAIDIPSGLNEKGQAVPVAVNADLTISMGALKTAFFTDEAKDLVGKIEVVDLGLPRSIYETETSVHLLEKTDMHLPIRDKQNTHKKSFGHCGIVCGEKPGAGLLSATSALKFGAGLVSICGKQPENMQYDFMYSPQILQEEFTAISIGSGLGRNTSPANSTNKADNEKNIADFNILLEEKNHSRPILLDADVFYYDELKEILPKLEKAVLTPHPKEFSSLLKICEIGEYSVSEIQKNRFELLGEFCRKYPNLIVLLKGANTLIGKGEEVYINNLGTSALSKAGSGDVLSGLIVALLAQGYSPLDSAITGSLAHSLAGRQAKTSYSLTASELIEEVSRLEEK